MNQPQNSKAMPAQGRTPQIAYTSRLSMRKSVNLISIVRKWENKPILLGAGLNNPVRSTLIPLLLGAESSDQD